MVVKIYISGISGNKEVKKRQQRVLMILDSKNIKYEVIDITEPGRETDKDFMQNNSKSNGGTVSDPNPRSPLPPQMFNGEEYCGDYDQFDLANEVDTLEQFLKLEVPPEEPQVENAKDKALNGDLAGEKSKEGSLEPETDKAIENEADQNEITADGNKSPVKENTPLREDGIASKEATPTVEEIEEPVKAEQENERNVEKEASPERQKSIEKTESPEKETTDEVKEVSKESSPEKVESINENGTVSSREQSEEKQAAENDETDIVERKKDNPSELLIESEQAASVD